MADIEDKEHLKSVREALELLPKEYQEIVVLRYIDDLSTEEIATIKKKSKNAVYILISRALKALREIIEKSKISLI